MDDDPATTPMMITAPIAQFAELAQSVPLTKKRTLNDSMNTERISCNSNARPEL